MFSKNKIVNSPFIWLVTLFIAFSLVNIPVLTTLWRHSFDDGTYSHAYLIPFITLYLYYQLQSDNLLVFRTRFSWLSFALFLASCYGLFVTSSAQISIGYWLASLAVITSAILMLYQYNWRILFPSIFLILIIPMWGSLAVILQSLSVNAVSFIMGFTGIPTYVEGNLVAIPAGIFEIAGGCSGLRYLIVSLAMSSLFSFLYLQNIKNIFIFFLIAITGALITNWIRITLLIIIGQYTNMTSALMTDHNNFGWYIFIPFMFLLFTLGNYLAKNVTIIAPPKKNTSIHKVSISLIIVSIFISSTYLSTSLINDQTLKTNALEQYKKQKQLKPFIHFYSQVSIKEINIEDTIIFARSYSFSGYALDAKPTFYQNKIAPNSWKENNTHLQGQWNITELQKGKNKALIATSFQLQKQLFPNKKGFKIERLKAGLFGIKNTKLHWIAVHCETNCKQEKNKLNTLLQNLKIE